MPYPHEHAARLTDPAQYDRFRRENDKFGTGIHAIWGIKGTRVDLQAIRFDASRFTVAEAKAWLTAHDHHPILFEPASGEKGVEPMNRAYSLITVKSIDADRRIITGTATTPSADRLGDIIEPLGVNFANPLPLLLYHDTTQPVGTAKFDKPTKQGIEFTASLPVINDPPHLRDRITEAWESIRAGLIRGVSVGFRVLENSIEPLKTGGYRYLKTEVLELSLVTVPANQQATIHAIKTYDVPRPAASGAAGRVPSTPSGAADRTKDTRSMRTSEELTATRAQLKTKHARLLEIESGGENEVESETLKLEAKGITAEINDLTDRCERLQARERAEGQLAAPVVVRDVESGGEARHAHVGAVEVKSVLPPGYEFARYVICKMASVISQGSVSALDVARQRYPDQPRIQMLLKAAVAGATTTDPTNLGALVYAQTLVTEFIEFLRPKTILGKFGMPGIPDLTHVPFNIRIVGQTTGGAGYWVGQAKPKPLTHFDVTAGTLTWAKVANIAVFSDELARFSNPSAESLIRNGLAKALIQRLDIDFVDPNKAVEVGVSPASITNGIVGLTPSGTDAAAVRADLAQLIAPFIAADMSLSTGVIIMSEMTALAISLMVNALGQPEFPTLTMKGGTLQGFPVITSQYAAIGSPVDYIMILVNAEDIFISDDGQVTVDASREAALEMDDSPEGSPSSEGKSLISLWQTDQIGLKAVRYINWARRREAAVAWLDNVAYSVGSP